MRISDWSSDVCSSDLAVGIDFFQRIAGDAFAAQQAVHIGQDQIDGVARRHLCEGGGIDRRQAGLGHGSRSLRECSDRSEEHTSELQSLMRISYAVFCLKKKRTTV